MSLSGRSEAQRGPQPQPNEKPGDETGTRKNLRSKTRISALVVQGQRGVALLLAIFSLLLISAIGVSLIVMSGTESAVNSNYKRSTAVFYAAQAGLEEARERLVSNAADAVRGNAQFPNEALPVPGQMLYILNPAPGDPAFSPQTGPASYLDTEYQQECWATHQVGTPCPASKAPAPNAAQLTASSAMATAGGLPPLNYKWVRITLKTEATGGVDLDGNGTLDGTTAVRAQFNNNQCLPSMPGCTNDPNQVLTTKPIYRLTAMALDPFGSRRMVQAEVAEMPVVNPNGAIASQAGVTLNGNFNAFGAWPPIVTTRCIVGNIATCGDYVSGKIVGDCSKPYDPVTDTCAGVPRSHKDYCNVANAVNAVASAGNISAGNYDEVPDQSSACTTNGPGCIFTVSPLRALDPNVPNWPYNMNDIMAMFAPPVTEPITNVTGISCGAFDSSGNRTCDGQGVQIGALPSPWPSPPNTQQVNNVPRLVFADVGPGGLLKLTGGSSGSGLLVVNGDLAIGGGFQWYGEILVHGVVTFLGGGSTPTNVIGGIIAGKDVTNVNTTTGGSVSVVYNSCAYRNFNLYEPLRYLGFREVPQ